MAISKIASAGITADFDNTLTAADIAANAIGISELDNTATGITSTHHKVPTYADGDARDAAIGSPATGMIIFNTDANALQQYTGTIWSTISPAPTVTSISGFLNEDTDSTLSIFGSNFSSASGVKMFTAAAGGTQIGAAATVTFINSEKLTAVFGGASIGAAGSSAYIEIENAGVTNRFSTAITVNADPAATHAGATGTSANTTTHLGTYGGIGLAGGGTDQNTLALVNFDRGGGTDTEDSSNIGHSNLGSPLGDYLQVGHKTGMSGNAVIKSTPFGDGKTAMFFDGSNDKLVLPNHADFNFGTGDFSIEFWARKDTAVNTSAIPLSAWQDGASGTYQLEFKSDGTVKFMIGNASNSIVNLIHQDSYEQFCWVHVAICRASGVITLFLDGQASATTLAANFQAGKSDDDVNFGRDSHNNDNYWNGYIDEIRVVKGVAVYTGNFTVPTSRLSTTQSAGTNIAAITGTATKLLIHSNQSYDVSGNTTVTIGQNASDVAQTTTRKWTHAGSGAWSMGSSTAGFMAATGLPNIASSGAYTIEAWINPSDTSGSEYLFDWRSHDASGTHIYCYTTATNILFRVEGTSEQQPTWTAHTGWKHIAIVRDTSGNGAVFHDGNRKGAWTGDTAAIAPAGNFIIGRRCNFSSHFTGHLDDFRFSNTARYDPTSTTYTQPAAAFTSDANTLLLLNGDHFGFTDSSSSSHTITPTGSYHSANHYGVSPAIPWPGNGKRFGSCGAYFDGDASVGGDRATIDIASNPAPMNPITEHTQTKTIEFWFYYYPHGTNQTLVRTSKVDNSSGGGDYNFRFYLDTSDNLKAYYLIGGSYVTGTSSYHVTDFQITYPPLRWWHFAFCCTSVAGSSGVSKLYINGKYVASANSTYQDQWWRKMASPENSPMCFGGGSAGGEGSLLGFIDHIRVSNSIRYTGTTTSSFWSNTGFTAQPTKLFGAIDSATLPTVTLTGTATQLAADEDIEFTSVANTGKASGSQHLTDTGIGLTLTNLTGGDKNKATLTGTLGGAGSTTHSNMPVKIQVRKTLGNAAYNNSTTVTFSGGTLTTGLAPAMPVSGTGIPAGATISSVDSTTVITLSAATTGGSLTSQSLIFLDLTRATHINGSDTLSNSDAMLSIATGAGLQSTLFNARRYVGDADPAGITGFGFQPDMVWTKKRSGTESHAIMDSVRGSIHRIYPDAGSAGATSGGATSFDKDGFTTSDGYGSDSENNQSYIAWGWKAGGPVLSGVELVGSGATMSGTSGAGTIHNSATGVTGSLTSITQSVNQVTGFSITKYAGGATGTNQTASFPHNLGGTPDFIMVKCTTHNEAWMVFHSGLGTDKNLILSEPDAQYTASIYGYIDAPSSTLINLHSSTDSNSAGNRTHRSGKTYICFAWKAVAGASAFGTYEGNGSGKTVTLPNSETFTPSMLLIKNTEQNDSWRILDKFRGFSTSGGSRARALAPDNTSAESTGTVGVTVGSGQWQMNTTDGAINGSGEDYIYAAFA